MENVLLYIFVNFNLTIVFRMLQGVSPLKIRLDRIRNYDPPYATSVNCIKILFGILFLYIGIPMMYIENKWMGIFYLFYWFLTIWWWRYFSLCDFKRCMYISGISFAPMLAYVFLYPLYIPLLWWSAYTFYLSYWYNKSYVNTNFILS